MQFSHRFKQLCKENGVTQKQALADMGLGRNAAQSWITCRPSAEALLKISEYFRLSIDDVLGVENKKTPTPEGERSEEDMNLLERYREADESTRAAIRLLLKF